MKKFLLIFMAIITANVLSISSFTFNASAAGLYLVKDSENNVLTRFYYDVTDEGYAEIYNIIVYGEDLTIPSSIEGYPVKSVNMKSLQEQSRKNLKTFTVEDGIEELNIFLPSCTKLESVYLPETLKAAEINFRNCTSLESITIPGGLKTIPYDFAFSCTNLKEVTIGEGVEVIGEYAFAGCESLESVIIPDSVWNIDDCAFNACLGLKNVTMSKNIQYIGDYAFEQTAIESIKLSDSLEEIGEYAFSKTALKSLKLPSKIKSIGYKAFYDCQSLEKINIPKSVINNVNKAWSQCNALSDVTLEGDMTAELYDALYTTPWIEKYNADYEGDFIIFDGCLVKYKGDDKNPVIPDTVETLGGKAFTYADIDTVTFSPNISVITQSSFKGSEIKSLTIPATISKVESLSFALCYSLEEVIIEGKTAVADDAFLNCRNIDKSKVQISSKAVLGGDAFRQTPLDEEWVDMNTVDEVEPTAAPEITPTPTPASTPSAEEPRKLSVSGKCEIIVDEKAVEFPDAKPFIDENERTQVPIRAVAELLNCAVDWNQETQTVTITKDNGDTVALTIGSRDIIVNGKSVEMDTEAIISNDRAYIPVRFIAEALGLEVEWTQNQ